MTTQEKSLLLISLVALVGATNGIAAKFGTQQIPPLGFVASRVSLALLILLPQLIKKKFFKTKKLPHLLTFSLLATANIGLFTLGISKTNVSMAATLYTAVPVLTAVLSHFLYSQTLSPKKLFGISLGFIGAATIIISPALSQNKFSPGTFQGNLIVSLAVISFSLHTALSKKIQKNHSPSTITQAFILTASIVLLPLALMEMKLTGFWPISISISSFLAIVYVALVSTIGFYFLYQYAIKKTTPIIASLNAYLQPVFAIILGIIIFQDKLTLEFILGAVLALISVYLVTYSSKDKNVISIKQNIPEN